MIFMSEKTEKKEEGAKKETKTKTVQLFQILPKKT